MCRSHRCQSSSLIHLIPIFPFCRHQCHSWRTTVRWWMWHTWKSALKRATVPLFYINYEPGYFDWPPNRGKVQEMEFRFKINTLLENEVNGFFSFGRREDHFQLILLTRSRSKSFWMNSFEISYNFRNWRAAQSRKRLLKLCN